MAAAAVAESARRGYLDGDALASVFSWLRPNDLIWNYVVNNYLLGKEPPAFDILYWNQDTVRMAAGLHRDFVMIGARERAGDARRDARCSAATWTSARSTSTATSSPGPTTTSSTGDNAYRSTQLLGGDSRFVLSTSGHIQALINPPAPARVQLPRRPPTRPRRGADAATQLVAGLHRLARRARRRARARAPSRSRAKAVAKAPGTYVHAN